MSLEEWESLEIAVLKLPGLGPKSKDKLIDAGFSRVVDLISLLPRRYQDYSKVTRIVDAPLATPVLIAGTVIAKSISRTAHRNIPVLEILLDDDYGTLRVVWFNQPYLNKKIKKMDRLSVTGKIRMERQGRTMTNPNFERDEGAPAGIVPIYRQVGGLRSEQIAGWIDHLLEVMPNEEPLPHKLVAEMGFPSRRNALKAVHFPENPQALEALKNRTCMSMKRLAFEEFFLFQQRLTKVVAASQTRDHPKPAVESRWLGSFKQQLPFRLTGDQERVVDGLFSDLVEGKRIHALVQGDVGCGKTVVGLAIAFLFARAGFQSALLCPTTVLSDQHGQTARSLLEPLGIRVEVLTRRVPASREKEILADMAEGKIHLLIGTHKIFQKDVHFARLGLAMIDEQHRFGVAQRRALLKKGSAAHYLAFSATPIPRSLAMTLYGGYQVLQIREKPAERLPIQTRIMKSRSRAQIIDFARQHIERGNSVFWVFPLIEGEDEEQQERSAANMYEELKRHAFPGVPMGMVHGRMKKEDINAEMEQFSNGQTRVLVATTVIEVGVDVPRANIMVVESANHFGLSQLHQLRGRVGRGDKESYCFFVADDDISGSAVKRMKLLAQCQDGFELAEFDLHQRGCGNLLGRRQSGTMSFRFGDPWTDRNLMNEARARVACLSSPSSRGDE